VAERSRFFPLCARRPTGLTRPPDSARVPTPRLAACRPSGMIRSRSPHSESRWQGFCSNTSPVALSAPADVYDTVELKKYRNLIFSARISWCRHAETCSVPTVLE
jgi:hypothetical protein